MSYSHIKRRLDASDIIVLDGGTGTELEKRGVPMDPEAWCGAATLDHAEVLERIHRDYIAAGADVITANTYASSRLMLKPAGLGDRFFDINRTAIETAHRARQASGNSDVVIAGSLSQMFPMVAGAARNDPSKVPSAQEMADAFGELADLHRSEGCDLILLEMMYYPDRIRAALKAAIQSGLPVWIGLSVRRDKDGNVLAFAADDDIPFADIVALLADFDVAAAGIMHSPSNIIGDATEVLKDRFEGPLLAYPDSGYFKMPNWQFEDVISPEELLDFARQWAADEVQIIGGCCGLSPEHIAAIATLRK